MSVTFVVSVLPVMNAVTDKCNVCSECNDCSEYNDCSKCDD
jgi:hypothetical protein